jgi:hypothetical protein
MLDGVAGLTFANGYLYAADRYNSRVVRYEATTGAYKGWIGLVYDAPTGGAPGCGGLAPLEFTPGWCLGGRPMFASTRPGFAETIGVFADGPDLYVTDSANAVQKLTLSGDAVTPVGWRGRVLDPLTGGDPGCASTPLGGFTPGWCTGGTADGEPGPSDPIGALYNVSLITGDATYLYIADAGNHRILRFPR